ncbi:hypothetical protein [Rhizobium leguminosarum]|uniref:hypothetical protein n=1 Tax=Rhizobium leguminosarum TaxID=384 RepID=UPI000B92D8D4|nr:hypothetical protein [Rhizobium leguminosarum]ASS55892.1 hypothetical protein CHR56_15695 [Rhizobium leguminosarum bv. viciae]
MAYLLCNIHEYLIRSDDDKRRALKEGKKLGLTWVSSSIAGSGYQMRFARIKHVKDDNLVPFAGKERGMPF